MFDRTIDQCQVRVFEQLVQALKAIPSYLLRNSFCYKISLLWSKTESSWWKISLKQWTEVFLSELDKKGKLWWLFALLVFARRLWRSISKRASRAGIRVWSVAFYDSLRNYTVIQLEISWIVRLFYFIPWTFFTLVFSLINLWLMRLLFSQSVFLLQLIRFYWDLTRM